MTDRYTKLIKEVQTTTTNAITVACVFLVHWVENYGIQSEVLTNDGSQFVLELSVAVRGTLGKNNRTNTDHYQHFNG